MLALLSALAVGGGRPARADSALEPRIRAPGVAAAGQGDWLWVLWLGEGGEDPGTHVRATRLAAVKLTAGKAEPWLGPQAKILRELVLASARGERLDVFLSRPISQHYVYEATGPSQLAATAPRNFRPVAAASDGLRLYLLVLAAPSPPAATQVGPPESAPTTAENEPIHPPPGAEADTQPDETASSMGSSVAEFPDREAVPPSAPPRPYHLLVGDSGPWKTLPRPPASVDRCERLSLVVHLEKPTLVYLIDGRLFATELLNPRSDEPRWQALRPTGDAAPPPAVLPRLVDVKALSINKQLYVVGWPSYAADAAPLLAQWIDGQWAAAELPGELFPGGLVGRYRDWDVASWGRWLVAVCTEPDPGGLKMRRYDVRNRRFDGPWEPIDVLLARPSRWVEFFREPLFTVLLVAVLAALLLLRRRDGQVRLSAEVAPAGYLNRFLAFVIDALPPAAVAYLLVYRLSPESLGQLLSDLSGAGQQSSRFSQMFLVWQGLLLAYMTAGEAIAATTPGKRLFHLSVCSVRGGRAGLGQIVIRNLVRAFELFMMGLPTVIIFVHPARQRLGDLLAGTVVVGPHAAGGQWRFPPDQADGRPPSRRGRPGQDRNQDSNDGGDQPEG